jgi:hypothetical protein
VQHHRDLSVDHVRKAIIKVLLKVIIKMNKLILLLIFSLTACSQNTDKQNLETNATKSSELYTVSRSEYLLKLQGFWLGKSIANWTGLVTEMDKVGTPETLPFYTDKDWGSKDLPAMWGEGVPHSNVIDSLFVEEGQPWGADDDTDIEYMYQYLHEVHQTSLLTAEQISAGWLTHTYSEEDAPVFKKFPDAKAIKENFLWESNQQARILMTQGMLPPETSEPKHNSKYMMIDAQLTTEIFGLLAPAIADVALKIAQLPIRVSAKDDAQWISQFYITMHSLASKVDQSLTMQQQTYWLAEQARLILPEQSTSAKMYDFIINSYQLNQDKIIGEYP